jgi:hypothetical protein
LLVSSSCLGMSRRAACWVGTLWIRSKRSGSMPMLKCDGCSATLACHPTEIRLPISGASHVGWRLARRAAGRITGALG